MQEYLYNLATDKQKGFAAGLIKILLFILAVIYGLLLRALIFIYNISPVRLKCKVISVGNITLGGTGKTALVEFIARYLRQEGRRVAVLSRGYKRESAAAGAGKSDYAMMGDEPLMLKNNLGNIPVLVDPDRIRSGNSAIRDYGADTVILDDGLQQWRLKKDLEIVTIDAANPFGNRWLLPRGILRQPLSTLSKADIFILTKTDLGIDTAGIKRYLKRINPSAEIFESAHKAAGFYRLAASRDLLDTAALKGKTVTAFSGIADPFYFENTLKSLGVNIGLSFRFPDHHAYSQKDLADIVEGTRRKNIEAIVTTEKDAARLSAEALSPKFADIFVLRITLAIIKDEEGFYHRLRKLYSL